MIDRDEVTTFAGLPIQPTGSGVADLEMQREQDALADDGDLTGAIDDETDEDAARIIPPEQPPMDDAAGGPQADVTASGAE